MTGQERRAIMEHAAATLRAERARRGMTLEAAASGIGISKSTLSKYEHAQADMGFTAAVACAAFYGLALSDMC